MVERGWRKGRRVVRRPLRGTLRRRGNDEEDAVLVSSSGDEFEDDEGLY